MAGTQALRQESIPGWAVGIRVTRERWGEWGEGAQGQAR